VTDAIKRNTASTIRCETTLKRHSPNQKAGYLQPFQRRRLDPGEADDTRAHRIAAQEVDSLRNRCSRRVGPFPSPTRRRIRRPLASVRTAFRRWISWRRSAFSPQKLTTGDGLTINRPVRSRHPRSQRHIKIFPKADLADDAQVNICSAYCRTQNDKAVEACDTRDSAPIPGGDNDPGALLQKWSRAADPARLSTRARGVGARRESNSRTPMRDLAKSGSNRFKIAELG